MEQVLGYVSYPESLEEEKSDKIGGLDRSQEEKFSKGEKLSKRREAALFMWDKF